MGDSLSRDERISPLLSAGKHVTAALKGKEKHREEQRNDRYSTFRKSSHKKIKSHGIELRTGKIIEENVVQSVFQQTLGDKFTFQQDNNLKHKAKYILELLTKKTVNVPEWPSYSFDLNRLENLWQDLKMAV